MPRRLNEGEVRDLFIKAGFIPDNDFRYTNSKRKYRVFDILHNKYVKITPQTLKYNINLLPIIPHVISAKKEYPMFFTRGIPLRRVLHIDYCCVMES